LTETIELPSVALIERLAPLMPVPGLPGLLAFQAPDVFAVWQAWEHETGRKQDVPFWATVWPAARLTAQYLGRNPHLVAGRTVLDFGCGGGMVAVAALKAGASKAIANDIDPVALWMAERNAKANGVLLETEERNLLDAPPSAEWGVIFVADLFYEKPVAEAMLRWLKLARGNGTRVYIADASRPFGPREGVETLLEETFPTDSDLEGSSERLVRLLAYLP
jgi:predicted nicotinamide N-methyase